MYVLRFIFSPLIAFTCLFLSSTAQIQTASAQTNHASAQLDQRQDRIHGGSELTFKIKLDEPLPAGAHFDLRLTPVAVNQEVSVSSGEPANPERTEFILHAKLPDQAFPGPWHVGVVWLFLPGASWTTSRIALTDVSFTVEGHEVPLPTKGTATLITEDR